MKLSGSVCALLALAAGLPFALGGSGGRLYLRQEAPGVIAGQPDSKMLASGVPRTTLPMGILWEDGAPTSCGLVFISDTVAVGAASCYDTNENMAVDHRRYAVYMSSPEVKTPQPLLFGPAVMVMLHPAYDPTTFANNIALLWFQPNAGAPNIHFAIASAPSMWTKAQVFRTMNNGAWTDNMSDITPEPPIAKRQAASELFNFNQGDFYCNVLGSAINNGCALPYKATYGIANDQLAYVGVYSHSAAAKSTFPCEAIVVYHYYLNIANFIPWINTLVQPSVVVGVLPNQLPGPADPAYKMVVPKIPSSNGMSIWTVRGNGVVVGPSARVGDLGSVLPNGHVATTTTEVTTTTASAQPTTTSTTTTQTVTTNVASGVQATVTAPSTVTTTTTSTTSSTTTSTTTATYTSTAMSATTTSITSTLRVTATVFSAIGGNSMCPPITPCLQLGGPATVQRTQTQTSTTTVTYVNFGASGVVVSGGQPRPTRVSTILVTSVQNASTATVTVTDNQPSSSTTVTVAATGPAGGQGSTMTIVHTATAPSGSLPAPEAANPNHTLVISVAAVAVLLLVVVCIAIWMYCRGKSRPKGPATDFPYHPYARPDHVPGYSYGQHDLQSISHSRQEDPARQGWHSNKGNYTGYR